MPEVLRLPDAEIAYEIHGSGDPLVLIPGFASGAWSWAWQVNELAVHSRVVTFDPRGVGRSKISGGAEVSISKIAEDVSLMLDALGVQAANVAGISFGGFAAQEFALRYPKRLRKLVLASTSFGGPNHVLPAAETLAAMASTAGLNSAERIRQNVSAAFTPDFRSEHGDEVERFCRLREENPVPEDVYLQQLRSAMTFNAESRVGEIRAETLVITGEDDTVVPPQNSRNLAARLPHAELAVIENAGHMLFVEKADAFNRIVTEFLR